MDKKVVIIASAVLAFFAGAIWVSEVPVVATLVACLEVCAGFGLGFWYKSVLDKDTIMAMDSEIHVLRAELEEATKKVRTASSTRKSTKGTRTTSNQE